MTRFPLDPPTAAILPSSETVAGLPSVAAEGALSWVLGRGRFFQRLGGAMLAYSAKPNIAGTGSEWSANGTTGNFSALPVTGGVDGTFIVAR